MKVLITSNLTYPHVGGVENSIRHLSQVAYSEGDDVLVISSDIPAPPLKDNIPVKEMVPKLTYNSFRNMPQPFRLVLSFFSAFFLYRNTLKRFDPDVVITRFHINALAVKLAGARNVLYLVPGVVKYQNNKDNLNRRSGLFSKIEFYVHSYLQKLSFQKVDKLLVFSKNMREQILQIVPHKKISTVRPGVDLSRFHPESKINNHKERVDLLCMGRLVKAKAFDLAVASLKHLPQRFVLNIVGSGEELEQLKALTIDLELEDRVLFHGATSRPEDFYKKADIFILSSVYEPFGQIMLEAAASGLPIVAFKPGPNVVTATEEALGDLACYADTPSAESLAKTIRDAYEDYYQNKTKDSLSISDFVRQNYSWLKLYTDLKG